ncbi:MAG: LLM class flavin-dependent oxidoreductase [Proteobacteria bacterium]|nr:LLM class flavin-dependent oxidoreductase [Pseudomonadota bacterium]
MAGFALRFDLRAPDIGAPAPRLYREALNLAAYADQHGAGEIIVSEHHGSDDGYLPSAQTFAAAVAARTERCRVVVGALILPLLDPIRAAEETLVVDHVSQGRVEVVVGLGYVASEFAMFGLQSSQRAALLDEKLPVFAAALTGEPVEYRGARFRVTPPPVQRPRPPVLVGGGVAASARRAARVGDGFMPMLPKTELYAIYEDECKRLGRTPGRLRKPEGPMLVHVAEDPERAWSQLGPHVLHEMNAYGRWATEGNADTPFRPMEDVATIRQLGLHAVVTPDECVALAEKLGPETPLLFHPLVGGLDPDVAWESLELFVSAVLPRL